jgi:hypothetical protein
MLVYGGKWERVPEVERSWYRRRPLERELNEEENEEEGTSEGEEK